MSTIIEETNGCIIYRDKDYPIVIDTPLYRDVECYREWVGSRISPSNGILAEGVEHIHMFMDGTEHTINKADLLREVVQEIYNYGVEKAIADGYKPFDQSAKGQEGLVHMYDVISLIIMQIKDYNTKIRIPYMMPYDYSQVLDTYPTYYEIPNFYFGKIYDSIRHLLPSDWCFTTTFAYSYVFLQYFQNNKN
jgi:hypothetical protein